MCPKEFMLTDVYENVSQFMYVNSRIVLQIDTMYTFLYSVIIL